MDTTDLIGRCVKGEQTAWEEFSRQYHRLIEYVVVNTLKTYKVHYNHADVEDIYGNVVVALLANDCRMLRRYDAKFPLTNWLSMLAKARTIDYLRKKALPISSNAGGNGDDDERDFTQDTAVGREETPYEGSQKIEAKEIVNEALSTLPARDRLIIRLFFFENKKYREIADILGMTVSMVASNIYRAKMKLCKKLQPQE